MNTLGDFNNAPDYPPFLFDKKCSGTVQLHICLRLILQTGPISPNLLNALLCQFCPIQTLMIFYKERLIRVAALFERLH